MALAESCFGKNLGIKAKWDREAVDLFAESPSCFVLSVKPEKQADFEASCQAKLTLLGQVTDEDQFYFEAKDQSIDLSVSELKELWEGALACQLEEQAHL